MYHFHGNEVCLLHLSDKLGAARTLAHIEGPQPFAPGQPLPLQTSPTLLEENSTTLAALLPSSEHAWSAAMASSFRQPPQVFNSCQLKSKRYHYKHQNIPLCVERPCLSVHSTHVRRDQLSTVHRTESTFSNALHSPRHT